MGFPLDRGSVEDGILTCHWHHARFDLASGCTFDLWADDVPTCPVEVRDWRGLDQAVVRPWRHLAPLARSARRRPGPQPRARDRQGCAGTARGGRARARRSCGRRHCSASRTGTAGESARRSSPRSATCCRYCRKRKLISRSSTAPAGSPRTAMARRRDGSAPPCQPPDLAVLKRWLRHWTAVRHREAAERTLLTAIALAHRRPRLPPAVRGGDGSRLRRRRAFARLHQQGLRVPRPDRLGACGSRVAERGRSDGGGARSRGSDSLAPPDGPGRIVRDLLRSYPICSATRAGRR